jgi:hypothetical protein
MYYYYATTLENLNDMVWWKEELARVEDQIPVKQARIHLQLRKPEFEADKIRIVRNGRPWKGEPVITKEFLRTHKQWEEEMWKNTRRGQAES